MVMGDSDAEMDGMSELEGEEIETGAEQPAGQAYAGGKENGGAVWQEGAIGVVGDQEAGGARAIPTSTVQKLAESGDRSEASASTKQPSVRRVQASLGAPVVMETGPAPPLLAVEGRQAVCGDPECEAPMVCSVAPAPFNNVRGLTGTPVPATVRSHLLRAKLPGLPSNCP